MRERMYIRMCIRACVCIYACTSAQDRTGQDRMEYLVSESGE